jgi:hypothetical protein
MDPWEVQQGIFDPDNEAPAPSTPPTSRRHFVQRRWAFAAWIYLHFRRGAVRALYRALWHNDSADRQLDEVASRFP